MGDPEADREEGDADEQDGQQRGHVRQRRRRVLRFRWLEGGHAGRDGLGAGQRHGAGREGSQEEDERQRLEGPLRLLQDLVGVAAALAEDDDPERPDRDHEQRREDEQVGRDGEDVAGLAQATQVADGDEADRAHPDDHAPIREHREGRDDLLDR